MKAHLAVLAAMCAALLCMAGPAYAAPPGFVSVNGTQFVINGKQFHFSGTNNYYLRYGNANCVAYDVNSGCAREIFDDAAKMNLSVIRTWGFADGYYYWGSLQPSLGVYDEANFVKFDLMLREAADRGLRLVIPLVNNWNDYGGMCWYLSSCNIAGSCSPDTAAGTHDQFYTDACAKQAYKNYVSYVVNRTNTLTGVKYKDDPTIFAWELANEPRAKSDPTGQTLDAWVAEMSAFIKSVDPNHLVTTGEEGYYIDNRSPGGLYDGREGVDFIANHNHSSIDYSTFHLYPDHWSISEAQSVTWTGEHINDSFNILGKPVVLGEFGKQGSLRDQFMTSWYSKMQQLSISGNMFWMLRDSRYIYSSDYGVNYPEDASTNGIILGDVDFWRARNSGLSPANYAPAIQPMTGVTVTEGETVTITPSTNDLDGDYVFLSISDGYRFNRLGNAFLWKTSSGDAGGYAFVVKASDGVGWSEERVAVTVLPSGICTVPANGATITANTVLCSGAYNLPSGITVGPNVTLDCNGSTIYGGDTGWGITIGGNNTILKNCSIRDYTQAIQLIAANNVTMRNIYAYSSYHGINMRESSGNTIINSTFVQNFDIGVYCYHSKFNSIFNSTFVNNGKGVYTDGCSNGTVEGNMFFRNWGGAVNLLADSSGNAVSGNNMTNDGMAWGQGGGIMVSSSNFNSIAGNNITEAYIGLYLNYASGTSLTRNILKGNKFGFGVNSYNIQGYVNYIDTTNTINGKPIRYWMNRSNEAYPSDSAVIMIINSTNITVNGMNGSANVDGAVIAFSNGTVIRNSQFSGNMNGGISIRYSDSVRVENNTIQSSNFQGGIHVSTSSGAILLNNSVTCHTWGGGIVLEYSPFGTLASNNMTTASDLGPTQLSVSGQSMQDFNHSIDATNRIDSLPILYYFNANGAKIENLRSSMVMVTYSRNVTVKNVTLGRLGRMVLNYVNDSAVIGNSLLNTNLMSFGYSRNNTISGNSIKGKTNTPALNLFEADYNTISNNVIGYSTSVGGLVLNNCDMNNITGNTISSNNAGLELENSYGNTLSYNNITNNSLGIRLKQSLTNITHNNIFSSTKGLDVFNYNATANYNWWGTRNCYAIRSNATLECGVGNTCFLNTSVVLNATLPSGVAGACFRHPADINDDGRINIFDLAAVGLCYGMPASGGCLNSDATGNGGAVDIFDLATIGLNYGKGY